MQVTKEGIERSRPRTTLGAVVAERGIELRKKGRVLVARCPFHDEKTPSFTITPSKGLFHCFGCGAAGDVIGFVTKHDKLSFAGALEALARRAGLDLKKLMEDRPRILQRTPVQALTPPPAHKDSAEGAPRKGAPPCSHPVAGRGALPPDLLREGGRPGVPEAARAHGPATCCAPSRSATPTARSEGDPEGRRGPGAAPRAGRHHGRGPRAAGRLHRGPDPGSPHGPVDDPLRPRAADRRATATCRARSAAS